MRHRASVQPAPTRIGSWRRLARTTAASLPAGIRLVSVDVFDTLVFRRVDAHQVVEAVASELGRRLRALGIAPRLPPMQARLDEFAARAADRAAVGGDFAATLQEVLPGWIERVAGGFETPPEFAAELEAFEITTEARWARANEPLLGWLRTVVAPRCRLVYCSDMYLPGTGIAQILEAVGAADLFARGYVSSDHGGLKETGRLFATLLAEEGITADRILHIGDQPTADGSQPRRAGLHAWVVRDRRAAARRRRARRAADRIAHQPFLAGPATTSLAGWLGRSRSFRTFEEQVGYRLLGPVFSTFALRLAERAREAGVRTLYFVAREGFTLEALHRCVSRLVWPSGGPEVRYLCVSRLTTFLARARTYGPAELAAALVNHPYPSVRRLLGPFGLGEGLMTLLAMRHGLELDARLPVDVERHPPTRGLLADPELLAAIGRRHPAHRRALYDYLSGEGYFAGGRVAFVDVGWGGQIQDNLARAFGDEPGAPEILGLYLGIRRSAAARTTDRSRFEGLLADERALDWHAGAAFLFVQLLETLLRAPHGTVVGYRREDKGRTVPVLREDDRPSRQQEIREEPTLALLRHGICAHAEDFCDAARMTSLRGEDHLPWARTLLDRLLRFPSPREVALFSSFSNVCDLGMEEVVPLGESKAPDSIGQRIREAPKRLRAPIWAPGAWTQVLGTLGRHPWVVRQAVRQASATSGSRAIDGTEASRPPAPIVSTETASAWNGVRDPLLRQASATDRRRLESARNGTPVFSGPQPRVGLRDRLVSSLDRRLANIVCALLGRRRWADDGLPLLLIPRDIDEP